MTYGPVFRALSPSSGELVVNADESGAAVKAMRSRQLGLFLLSAVAVTWIEINPGRAVGGWSR